MTIRVNDPFDIANDPNLGIAGALNPDQAQRELRAVCPEYRELELLAIRVTRHKPGRRCLIEYKVSLGSSAIDTWIGKVRAKGIDLNTFALMSELWRNGFDDANGNGASVPQPIGTIPCFRMWLQRKVEGLSAMTALAQEKSTGLARRIANALHMLHSIDTTCDRKHSIQNELAILSDRLAELANAIPQWSRRIDELKSACERLATDLSPSQQCGIHRDFHPDQVIVSGDRLYLLDLDLYSAGDPLLDAGNFVAHLNEFAFRNPQSNSPLNAASLAFTDEFLHHHEDREPMSLSTYSLLSLVRLAALSVRYLERRPFMRQLLEECESRLSSLAFPAAMA